MKAKRGFSLIEALVSLIIAAILLIAIYELHQSLISAQLRSQRALAGAGAQQNALELMEEVNPTLTRQGERTLASGVVVRWVATPLGEARPNTTSSGEPGTFEVQLYQVEVSLDRPGGRALADLSFQRLGWRSLYGELGADDF